MSYFSLRIVPSPEVKITTVVSKKVSKKAVIRNLIKRRVRAAMREITKGLRPGFYMIIAKSGAETIKGESLKTELATLFKKG